MISLEYCQLLAKYGTWINHNLYSSCAELSDAQRKADSGLFFKSIHSTLNHLLFGDIAWMSRFLGEPEKVPEIGIDLYPDFQTMQSVRHDWDIKIENWAATINEQWLAEPFRFTSKSDGITRSQPAWLLVTHMFQHATHHRGQITTVLSQHQIDYGITDLPLMPMVKPK